MGGCTAGGFSVGKLKEIYHANIRARSQVTATELSQPDTFVPWPSSLFCPIRREWQNNINNISWPVIVKIFLI